MGEHSFRTLSIDVSVRPGSHISRAARDLCELARRLGMRVNAEFNGVLLNVDAGDEAPNVERDWFTRFNERGDTAA